MEAKKATDETNKGLLIRLQELHEDKLNLERELEFVHGSQQQHEGAPPEHFEAKFQALLVHYKKAKKENKALKKSVKAVM